MEKLWEFRYAVPMKPNEEVVEISEAEFEKMLLRNVETAKGAPIEPLWQLARFYSQSKRHDEAMACLRRVMPLLPNIETKAGGILAMGQLMEQVQDYPAAIRYYKEALAFEPVNSATWFLVNNNLGFCFNILGDLEAGELYCRRAISIDPTRSNGYKNLGIALRGLGRLTDAAANFVRATKVNASDPRALKLLDEMLEEHPELQPEFALEMECCRAAVNAAAEENMKRGPVIHSGWRKTDFPPADQSEQSMGKAQACTGDGERASKKESRGQAKDTKRAKRRSQRE
jgi:tetratricopeptide (TPR) repeat protein